MDSAELEGLPLLAGLSADQVARVATAARPIHFGTEEVIVREGEIAFDVYAIVHGRAEVRHGAERVADLGAGDILGELALFPGHSPAPRRRRGASVVAAEPPDARVINGTLHREMTA